MSTCVRGQELFHGFSQVFEIFLRRQAPDVTNNKGIARNPAGRPQALAVATVEPGSINSCGHHGYRCLDAMFCEKLRHALAWRDDGVTKIAIAESQAKNEPFESWRILRNVMPIEFVPGMVRVYDRQVARGRYAKSRVAQKEWVMGMHDVGLEDAQGLVERATERDRHREIAASEATRAR
ncbi:hypothetical protein ASD12_05895 [Mesorhizobium sp. Root102]|nr:hypothetical protein ASD12_05895 [Mesorhizobium sp. Root102]